MNIVVCVKQIPDPIAPSRLDDDLNLDRTGRLVLDEADTYGVEMALQLVDRAGAGTVSVVSMSSSQDLTGLRSALAMGADKAIVVSDNRLRGTDALGTAKVLASVIRRELPDLIVCATESSDGYTGTLPVQLAELLSLPSITFAKSVCVDGSTLCVQRQTEAGHDVVTAPLPAVVSVTAGVVVPRYPSFKGIMAAKSKPVEVVSLDELGLLACVGASGARQEITEVTVAESRTSGEKYVDDGDGDGAQKIVEFLKSIKVL